MAQLRTGHINSGGRPMSEAESPSPPSNKDEISWMIRRLKNYIIEDDEPLIGELKELLEDPNIEDITSKQIQEYSSKVQETIKICNVLDRFPMKKIEGYMRKKKLDNLNKRLNDDPQMNMGSMHSI